MTKTVTKIIKFKLYAKCNQKLKLKEPSGSFFFAQKVNGSINQPGRPQPIDSPTR